MNLKYLLSKKRENCGGIPQIRNSISLLIIVNYCSIRVSYHSGRLFIFDGRTTVPFLELSYCDCYITIFAILSPIIEKNPITPSHSKIPAVVSNDSTPLNHSVICRDTERIKHRPTRPASPGKNILTIVLIFIYIPRFGIFHSCHLNSVITSVKNLLINFIPDFWHLRYHQTGQLPIGCLYFPSCGYSSTISPKDTTNNSQKQERARPLNVLSAIDTILHPQPFYDSFSVRKKHPYTSPCYILASSKKLGCKVKDVFSNLNILSKSNATIVYNNDGILDFEHENRFFMTSWDADSQFSKFKYLIVFFVESVSLLFTNREKNTLSTIHLLEAIYKNRKILLPLRGKYIRLEKQETVTRNKEKKEKLSFSKLSQGYFSLFPIHTFSSFSQTYFLLEAYINDRLFKWSVYIFFKNLGFFFINSFVYFTWNGRYESICQCEHCSSFFVSLLYSPEEEPPILPPRRKTNMIAKKIIPKIIESTPAPTYTSCTSPVSELPTPYDINPPVINTNPKTSKTNIPFPSPIRFSLIKRIYFFVLNVSKIWVFPVRLSRDLASLFLSGKTQPTFYWSLTTNMRKRTHEKSYIQELRIPDTAERRESHAICCFEKKIICDFSYLRQITCCFYKTISILCFIYFLFEKYLCFYMYDTNVAINIFEGFTKLQCARGEF